MTFIIKSFFTKSNWVRTWKFSFFQPCLFMSYLREIFKSIALYYFKHSTRCIFSEIKTRYWWIMLHFLVSKVERIPSVRIVIEWRFTWLGYKKEVETILRLKVLNLWRLKRHSFNDRSRFTIGKEVKNT